ncbi:S-layer homology domain-containing protein [Chengkuizengella axinellae]|uniref:S-layer homology domain-containing protein n=1 Tax=Chengkuizengella axinellae TaxID=3064388 RepID=A0ABT9J3Z9_9BACL|nr:S-layer homology domain-containing protein [Chengkuizengella sp. 2205SS18-9]MDP5276167.1 S-layer homology domain-containing protein [Chengkuizengella sp. 2205SS18-9]
MNFNKYITLFIFLLVLISGIFITSIAEAETEFIDVSNNHWAKNEIEFLVEKKFIGGFDDGTFKPDDYITRAQAFVIISKILELNVENRSNIILNEVDSNHWAYNEILFILDEELYKPDGTFKPDQPLQRDELAMLLVIAFSLEGESSIEYSDIERDYWAYDFINKLAANRISYGFDNNFKPKEFVTRAQFSTFLARILNDYFKLSISFIETTHDDNISNLKNLQPNHLWIISFPDTITHDDFNKNTVYILDSNDVKLKSYLKIQDNKGYIYSPDLGYTFGEDYSLHISKDITSVEEDTILHFNIRENNRDIDLGEKQEISSFLTNVYYGGDENRWDVEVKFYEYNFPSHLEVYVDDTKLDYVYKPCEINGCGFYGTYSFKGTVEAPSSEYIKNNVNVQYVGGEDPNQYISDYKVIENDFNIILNDENEYRGNSISNSLDIGSFTAESEKYIFHEQTVHNLYRTNKLTNYTEEVMSFRKLAPKGMISNFNYKDGWIYVNSISKGDSKIIKINEDGSSVIHLADFSFENMQIVGDWIYGGLNDGIYKMDLNGDELIKIADVNDPANLAVYKGWIFYNNDGFYAIRTNGEDKQKILNKSIYDYFVTDNGIYAVLESPSIAFNTAHKNSYLYKIALDGTEIKKISNDLFIQSMNYYDGWLYFNGYDFNISENIGIYKIKIHDNSTYDIIHIKDNIHVNGGFYINGDTMYFEQFLGGIVAVYKLKIDGTEYEYLP